MNNKTQFLAPTTKLMIVSGVKQDKKGFEKMLYDEMDRLENRIRNLELKIEFAGEALLEAFRESDILIPTKKPVEEYEQT